MLIEKVKSDEFFPEHSQEDPFMLPVELLKDQNEISADVLQKSKAPGPGTTLNNRARCVSVDTILVAPGGRNLKKEMFKGKNELVKFRCTLFEKKLLKIKSKRSGLSLSEYCRRVAYEKDITERLTDEQIAIYKNLIRYHNNFKSIGNLFRKKDPRLSRKVYELAETIQQHLQKFQP